MLSSNYHTGRLGKLGNDRKLKLVALYKLPMSMNLVKNNANIFTLIDRCFAVLK